MRIAIAGDGAGKPLADVVVAHLAGKPGVEVTDLSRAGYYADMAAAVAETILKRRFNRGILVCGTGIGVCISANKVPGIRAALVHDTYSAERASRSNNAQIITMGSRVIGPELAKTVVDAWLASEFDPEGPSAGNVKAIDGLDARYAKSRQGE